MVVVSEGIILTNTYHATVNAVNNALDDAPTISLNTLMVGGTLRETNIPTSRMRRMCVNYIVRTNRNRGITHRTTVGTKLPVRTPTMAVGIIYNSNLGYMGLTTRVIGSNRTSVIITNNVRGVDVTPCTLGRTHCNCEVNGTPVISAVIGSTL